MSLRTSGIIAAAAFILSFLLSLVSGTSMPMLLLRPAIFAALFFVLSGLVMMLVSRFLPELLEEGAFENDGGLHPGARINIMEGPDDGPRENSGEADSMESAPSGPVPAFMNTDNSEADSENVLGNISDLTGSVFPRGRPAGMDQNTEDGYTETESGDGFSGSAGGGYSVPSDSREDGTDSAVHGLSGSVDALPDLDSMAGAFLSSSRDEEQDTFEYPASAPVKRPASGKEAAWSGDFNAKDLAMGLRTVLSKEKEG